MHPLLTLEKRIEAQICGLDAVMSVFADDLHGHTVEIGADDVFESASTIKIFVLGCLFDCANKGTASLDEMLTYRKEQYVDGDGVIRSLSQGTSLRAEDAAVLMIILSDNIATNMLIDYLGIDRINAFIDQCGCSKTCLHRRLMSDGGGARLGSITPRDMGHFFRLLSERKLTGPKSDERMIAILRRQQHQAMLTGQLPAYYMEQACEEEPDLVYVASKSGTMDECRNDGGIVHTPYGDYVIVIMCTGFKNKSEAADHPAILYGQQVSRLLFDQYLALEGQFALPPG